MNQFFCLSCYAELKSVHCYAIIVCDVESAFICFHLIRAALKTNIILSKAVSKEYIWALKARIKKSSAGS